MKTYSFQFAWSALILLTLTACHSPRVSSPYTPADPVSRDTAQAQRLNQQAAELMDSDPEKAEQLLREALAADLFYGPAHNNLGVLNLSRDEMYTAASEFEWARKLMPGHPDPRLNLALVLERSGRVEEAIATYRTALEVRPGHMQTTQALTSCELRNDLRTPQTNDSLNRIALEGTSPEWRSWAQKELKRVETR